MQVVEQVEEGRGCHSSQKAGEGYEQVSVDALEVLG